MPPHPQTPPAAIAPLRLQLNQKAIAFHKKEKRSPLIPKFYQVRSHPFVLSSIKKRSPFTNKRSDRFMSIYLLMIQYDCPHSSASILVD
ncbi:hypothetical protein [Coleofasciculus sp. E1-EBD-02]|uniref:hypothetical protein n=1 Tax=Coleofasciculus sp. E1-EBD-02 TaxID=3068481 RepID=UPI0032F54868